MPPSVQAVHGAAGKAGDDARSDEGGSGRGDGDDAGGDVRRRRGPRKAEGQAKPAAQRRWKCDDGRRAGLRARPATDSGRTRAPPSTVPGPCCSTSRRARRRVRWSSTCAMGTGSLRPRLTTSCTGPTRRMRPCASTTSITRRSAAVGCGRSADRLRHGSAEARPGIQVHDRQRCARLRHRGVRQARDPPSRLPPGRSRRQMPAVPTVVRLGCSKRA